MEERYFITKKQLELIVEGTKSEMFKSILELIRKIEEEQKIRFKA